jgi:integrase/recombinase XerD
MEHQFEKALTGFREWLRLLNYSKANVYNSPKKIEEFLRYALQQGKTTWNEFDQELIRSFFEYLSIRKNERRPGGLSLHSLWNYRYTLNLFARYLRETGQAHIVIDETLKRRPILVKEVLTPREIKNLYEAIEDNALGMRDKTMLSVFYGCGVRKNEGAHLEVTDVLLESKMLYVRRGKGYKERYVPMTGKVKDDIQTYLVYGRPELLKSKSDPQNLFISVTGKAMKASALYMRLQTLKEQAKITRPVGLHTLRHSIATHLLQSGMKLEQIAKFLGHSTLESTQIYTHIARV